MRTAILCAVFWCSLGPVRASASTAPSAVEDSTSLKVIGWGLCGLLLARRRSLSDSRIQSCSCPTFDPQPGETNARKWFS
jgi:hypothetical protein